MCMQKFERRFKLIIIDNNFFHVTINEAFSGESIIRFQGLIIFSEKTYNYALGV